MLDNQVLDAQASVVEEFKNVEEKCSSYFDGSANVRAEEEGDAQEMYAQLTNVLQAVVTDKDCNIEDFYEGS